MNGLSDAAADLPDGAKILNDPVHGHIKLPGLCVRLIDTPQYQRLRQLQQLGGLYYVYPGASHRRFEHSLGVAFVSGKFLDRLAENQPRLMEQVLSREDKLCVQIAGLLHDVGHGPFSHMFDGRFLAAIDPDRYDGYHSPDDSSAEAPPKRRRLGHVPSVPVRRKKWAHEHASVALVDHIIESNGLRPAFEAENLGASHIHFIKQLILGSEAEAPPGFNWIPPPPTKKFLYQIIANKDTGIDVDRWDYLARDAQSLGVPVSYDATRLMEFARVMKLTDAAGVEALEICFHEKEAWQVYELYHTRYNLHVRAYQHKVGFAVEHMLCDALIMADRHLAFRGTEGQRRRLSETPGDMEAYAQTGDWIINAIEASMEPGMCHAQGVLARLRRRDLYVSVGQILLPPSRGDLTVRAVKARLSLIWREVAEDEGLAASEVSEVAESWRAMATAGEVPPHVDTSFILVGLVKLNYGDGGNDPVKKVHFYTEDKATGRRAVGHRAGDKCSLLTPSRFEERYLRVFSKDSGRAGMLRTVFERFCERERLDMTPMTPSTRKLSQD